jgi:hypothetical protein
MAEEMNGEINDSSANWAKRKQDFADNPNAVGS